MDRRTAIGAYVATGVVAGVVAGSPVPPLPTFLVVTALGAVAMLIRRRVLKQPEISRTTASGLALFGVVWMCAAYAFHTWPF